MSVYLLNVNLISIIMKMFSHYQQTINNSYFCYIIDNISTSYACKNIANKDEKHIVRILQVGDISNKSDRTDYNTDYLD